MCEDDATYIVNPTSAFFALCMGIPQNGTINNVNNYMYQKRGPNKLSINDIKTEAPANLNELKKSINRAANWRARIDAVEELGQYKNRETIELLKHCMTGDAVYKVQQAAYRELQALGEQVTMPERKEGELIKDTKKTLLRIKKSLPKGHSYEDFKEKLKKMRIDIYDTYEGEKGTEFDAWLQDMWNSIAVR